MATETADAGWRLNKGIMNYGSYQFRVFFVNEMASFNADVNQTWLSITGVSSESEPINYMQGTDVSVSTAPGRTTFADVELERIYMGVDQMYKWRRSIEAGKIQLADLKIELLNRNMVPIREIMIIGAWPKKWQMPDLNAGSSEPPIEKFSLAVSDIYEVAVPAPAAEADATTGADTTT